MSRKNTWAVLVAAAMLSMPLTACRDTKTLQENQQLKAQVAELQKQNGQAGNELESMTAERDDLAKENAKLKSEIKALQSRHAPKRGATRRRRRA